MNRVIGDVFWDKTGNISFIVILSVFIIFIVTPADISAKVSGPCVNCHTMHNSQDGTAVLRDGTGVGWDSGTLQGGAKSDTPHDRLLVTGCVGCHTNIDNADTIVTIGTTEIPIVFNTSGYPSSPLAGGNFYYVAQGGTGCPKGACDAYGHNVYGIAGDDAQFTVAPGRDTNIGCGDANSCHVNLSVAPATENYYRGGCQGCHVFTYHHVDNDVYRFLKGHGGSPGFTLPDERKDITTYLDYVQGVEDDDWEQETSTDHNWYKGYDGPTDPSTKLRDTHSISSFCGTCHYQFHQRDFIGGTESPWTRHPTDILLPQTGEYSGYDPTQPVTDPDGYSPEAPVAWEDPSNPDRAEAVVMCLSCHRPHGSNQPDMLRWDYDNMTAGGGTNSTGCFTCHTTKDDGS